MSRRSVTRGALWATPVLVTAASPPAFAASCGSTLQLLYGDYGAATSPIITYTGSKSTSCETVGGVTWSVTTYTLTITNTSKTQTISHLQVPLPYLTLSNTSNGCTTPATESANGAWSTPVSGYTGGPTAGRDMENRAGSSGTLSYVPFSTYSAIIPSTISGTGANSGTTLCSTATAASTVPVYTPPASTLAPKASTTFNLVVAIEAPKCPDNGYDFYAPDFVVGAVC